MKRCGSIRRSIRAAGVAAAGAALLTIGGCGKPLFSPDEPRSQYDRNDALRGQHAPSYVYDQYGTRRPNIRQRLLDTPD